MIVYRSQVCLQFPSFFDNGTGINSGPPTKTSMLKFGEAFGESVCFWPNLFQMFLLAKSQLVNEMRLQFESAVLTDSSNVIMEKPWLNPQLLEDSVMVAPAEDKEATFYASVALPCTCSVVVAFLLAKVPGTRKNTLNCCVNQDLARHVRQKSTKHM